MNNDINTMIDRARLLSSPTRISIWCALTEDGMHPSELAEMLSLAPATITYHLQLLHDAGLVRVHQCGRQRRYLWTTERLTIITESELHEQIAAASAKP